MTKKVLLSSVFWIAIITFTQAQTTLLSTDFSVDIPSNYTLLNQDGLTPDASVSEYTAAWIRTKDTEDTTNWVAASTSFFSPSGTASRWLVTPQLSLGSYGNYLRWNARSQDASYPDDYLILVSHTGKNPADFTDTIGFIQQEYVEWTDRSVSLSDEGYNDSLIYIAFVNVTEDGFKLYLDDITVTKEDPLGIAEPLLGDIDIHIYPNPTADFITIQSSEQVHYNLLDCNGSILYRSNESKLDVRSLLSGMYILEIETNAGIVRKKILKN